MIRILFFLVIFSNFSFSLEVSNPLFPKGEKIEDYIVNATKDISETLISHSGRFLLTLSSSYENNIIFWSRKDRKKLFEINTLNPHFFALSGNDKYLVYDEYSNICVYDIENKKKIEKFKVNETVTALDFSHTDGYIAIATKNKIYIYNIEQHKLVYFFTIKKSVKKIKISHNNKFLILQLSDNSIHVYDLKTSDFIYKFNFKNNEILDFDIYKDEKTIIVASKNKIYLCNIETKRNIEIKINKNINRVLFTNKNDEVIIAGYDSMYLYHIKSKQLFQLTNFRIYSSISISDDNRYLVTSSLSDEVFILELLNKNIDFLPKLLEIQKYFYISSKNILISQDYAEGINIWNLNKNRLKNILNKKESINHIDLSENKKRLVAISNKDIKLWDLDKNKVIYNYTDKNESISVLTTVGISQNEKLIAYINGNNYEKKHLLQILDINKSHIIQAIHLDNMSYIVGVNFIDNKYLVVHSYKKILLYDIQKNKKIYEINIDKGADEILRVYKDYYIVRTTRKNLDKYEVKNILTNKRLFSLTDKNKYILDIQDNYVFISDGYGSDKIYVWDLQKHKYISKKLLLTDFYHVSNYNKELRLKGLTNQVSKKIFYTNKSWVIIDDLKKKLYKYTTKNFLLNPKKFEPLIPNPNLDIDGLKIIFLEKTIKLINNNISTFTIQVKNITNHKLYYIDAKILDRNLTIKTKGIPVLEANEIKTMKVSINYNQLVEKSHKQEVKISINLGDKTIKQYVLKMDVEKRLEIDINNIKLEDNGISIKFKKFIDVNLTNLKVTLSEGNKSIENNKYYDYSFPPIETNNSLLIHLPSKGVFGYSFGKGHDFTVTISADEIKPYVFTQYVKFDIPKILYIFILMLIFVFIAILYSIYIGKYNLRLNKIMKGVDDILNVPLHKLPYYKKFLKRRMDKYEYELYFNYILENDLERVSQFFKINNQNKAQLFTEKASAKLKKINNNFFEIQLSKNFELSLDTFLLYFPSTTSINEMYTILKDKRATAIIVIGQNEEEQRLISESNQLLELPNVIGISPRNLKLFLLQSEHTKILAQIFSDKIDRTLISPYQSEGKIENELYFFGREKIIKNIYNKELSNYFIVGARQIGKSSLLKALERKFKDREDVVCITIEDTRYLLKEMATSLGLDRKSSLEEIELFISNSSKKYLFLIDEVDAFVQEEKENSYEMLHAFRALSQKKKAYFIMAGYWELFSQISFDYYSPIKNFGETIKLDKLEWNACTELVLTPMDNLNLNYKSADDAAEILMQTGQRANLIAMICDKIVKDLKPLSFVITKEDVENALYYNDELQKTYYSWREIPNNRKQSYITQIIVYASVDVDYFSLESVIELFESLDLLDNVTLDEIDESLQRLELMYIIKKNQHNVYLYTIPLMKEELMKDSEVRLKKVIDEFRKEYC